MTQTYPTNNIVLDYDPVVPCEWLPDREVRLSEYNRMIYAFLESSGPKFIDKYLKEYENAKTICIKKSAD